MRFVSERISEGSRGVCLTWKVVVNGEDGPAGISFNEVDADGKIIFARDIPAPGQKPPPLGSLALKLRPRLGVFSPRSRAPAMNARRTSSPRACTTAPSTLETLRTRPTRAAMATAWLGFSVYVAFFSPGSFDTLSADSLDARLLADAIDDPSSLNPIFFAVFNALGLIPAVNLALLMPGSAEQKPLPTLPFVGASFALGYGVAGPYLALRQPRTQPLARSELGFFTRSVTESRLYAAGCLAAAAALVYGLVSIGDWDAARAEFAQLFGTSKLVHVSTIDLAVLSGFAFEPIREDMCRRGWWDEGAEGNNAARLAAFCVPVIGPAAYILARPSLED